MLKPAVIEYDDEIDALIVTVEGELCFELYKSVIEAIMKAPEFRPNINVLYDARNVSISLLTSSEIREVSDYARSIAPRRGTSWKAAIVVSGMVTYGLARMFEIMSDDSPFITSVFREIEKARAWVKGKPVAS